jgi:chromosome segregation ATPase
VIETLMIFALGFLTAALFALLIVPALNARAERLVRRRLEALFPLSLAELTAEKDHLRAELAVRERRMEQKLEEIRASKHGDMEELGRRALRIDGLTDDLAARDATIGGLETDLSQTRETLSRTQDDLASARASLAAARETLGALESAHRATLGDLDQTRAELDRTVETLAQTRTALDEARRSLTDREGAYADLLRRHDETLSDNDTKRITISDLETRLATQTARGDEFERALTDRRSELSSERQRLTDLVKNLLAEQERGLVLEQRIRATEAEREAKAADLAKAITERDVAASRLAALEAEQETRLDAMTALEERVAAAERDARGAVAGEERFEKAHASEMHRLGEELSVAKATRATLEGQLVAAREERARLLAELGALKIAMKTPLLRGARTSRDRSSADLALSAKARADLLRRIDEVADTVLRLSEDSRPSQSAPRKASAG